MQRREPKWTQELRGLVFRILKREFGPFAEWHMADYPEGKKSEYETALRDIARFIGRLTGESFTWKAVRLQVRWAITKQSNVMNQGYMRQFILNKAAAIEEGFLTSADLPSLMISE